MSKVLSVRVDDGLYTKVSTEGKSKGEIINRALEQYFNPKKDEMYTHVNSISDEDISADVYNYVYNEIYNQEIHPISLEKKYLKKSIHILEGDKLFLVEQNRALTEQNRALTIITASKIPLLQRIKARLLKG